MKRRDFLALAGAAAAVPRVALAQQTAKVPRVAYLTVPQAPEAYRSFLLGLEDAGFVDGRNVAVQFFIAPVTADLPRFAADAVASKPDVIYASATQAAIDARNLTATIPIVFQTPTDPVAVGLIQSLSRPGGNLTGSMGAPNYLLAGKHVGLLREVVPNLSRIAFFDQPSPGTPALLIAMVAAGRAVGAEIIEIDVKVGTDFEGYVEGAKASGAQAIVIQATTYFSVPNDGKELRAAQARYQLPITADAGYFATNGTTNYVTMTYLALAHQLPTVCGNFLGSLAGGLLGYSANSLTTLRRNAAIYVAGILKGANPAEMAVELPTAFDLVVNYKTAKALGIIFPPSILAQATIVVE